MSTSAAPVKTALGQEELRHRKLALGQRYRTILLLVDGRRTLGEVLSLAQQAGSTIGHFEELVRMGLVEMPEMAVAPSLELAPGEAPDTVQVTSVDLPVPLEPESAEEAALPQPPVLTEEVLFASAEAVEVAEPVEPAAVVEAVVEPPPPAPPPPPREAAVLASPPIAQPQPAPSSAASAESVLEQARGRLLAMLRADGSITALRQTQRLRVVQTLPELIDLVWELERRIPRLQRSRAAQVELEAARDLLGLGNTQVAEDTQPGYLD
jgi:hypothetical protein